MTFGFFAIAYGALLSVMNAFSADMSVVYGNWFSTLAVHAVGLVCVTLLCLLRRDRLTGFSTPWYMKIGGLIGIMNVAFVNIAIQSMGVTANLVLMMVGQMVTSALADSFGWFHIPKTKMTTARAVALAVMLLGCAMMLWLSGDQTGGFVPVFLSVLTGLTVVSSRHVNGQLAVRTSAAYATWLNYVTGLLGTLVIFAVLGFPMQTAFPANIPNPWIYLSGAIGVFAVLLANLAAPRLPLLTMTVLVFIGQVTSGLLMDLAQGVFQPASLIGGLLVGLGLVIHLAFPEKKPAATNE